MKEFSGAWQVLSIGGLDRPRPDTTRANASVAADLQGYFLRGRRCHRRSRADHRPGNRPPRVTSALNVASMEAGDSVSLGMTVNSITSPSLVGSRFRGQASAQRAYGRPSTTHHGYTPLPLYAVAVTHWPE